MNRVVDSIKSKGAAYNDQLYARPRRCSGESRGREEKGEEKKVSSKRGGEVSVADEVEVEDTNLFKSTSSHPTN